VDRSILASVDILAPNESEARLLLGLHPADESMGMAEVGQQLLAQGPHAVIITLGSKGCLVIQREAEPQAIPAYRVQPVDTVGAGDAFNGGLAVALAEGRPLLEAARWANATAALSTLKVGAIDGLPRREAVAQLVQSI
jgi:ribokinase